MLNIFFVGNECDECDVDSYWIDYPFNLLFGPIDSKISTKPACVLMFSLEKFGGNCDFLVRQTDLRFWSRILMRWRRKNLPFLVAAVCQFEGPRQLYHDDSP